MAHESTGTKRTYTVASYSIKELILKKFEDGLNWQETASDHNISHKTVYYWAQHKNKDMNGVPIKKKKGKRTIGKIGLLERSFIEDLMAENPSTTLKEVKEKIFEEFNLVVSITTLSRAMHCLCFSHKKQVFVSHTANNVVNLQKRRVYCEKYIQYEAAQKDIIFIDESNFNLHCTRSKGWSRVGTRAKKKRVSAKGANLQMLGAINPIVGAIGFETFSGSIKQAEHDAWLIRVVEYAVEKGLQSNNLVIVLDNAPSHRGIESRQVYTQLEALGTKLLRLGPYSAPLNPIELIWNTIKAFIKRKVGASLNLITTVPAEHTQKSWRYHLMKSWAELSFLTITQAQVYRTTMHCRSLFERCLLLQPLEDSHSSELQT